MTLILVLLSSGYRCLSIRRARVISQAVFRIQASIKRTLTSNASSGLLGLKTFRSPSDFPLQAVEVVQRCEALRQNLCYENDPVKALLLLDQISNEVCSVIDVSEFCRVAHDKHEYRERAEEAFASLSMFIHSLNTDETLYAKLQAIVDTEEVFSKLPKEHRLFAKDLKAEFESGGIHLRGQAKDTAVTLQADVTAAETKFLQETSRDGENSNFILGPFATDRGLKMFSNYLGQYVEQSSDLPQGHVMCSASRRIAGTVIKSLDEGKLRETVWMNMQNEPKSNAINLGNMIKNRQALAKTLGYESFAHKYLANKVMKTPGEVQNFLSAIAETVQPKAQEQIEVLCALKRRLEGPNAGGLNPWDVGYLMSRAESEAHTQGMRSAISSVSEYFPVDRCIKGLIGITTALFGIEVKISDVSSHETWLNNGTMAQVNSSSSKQAGPLKYGYMTGAIKCDFTDAAGRFLGTVYLDLFNRPVKFPGAAHFTLRCGCSNSADNYWDRTADNYQLPVVALSFNFIPPSADNILKNKMPCLTLSDVETLHHEWGHALHSVLSRTTFQHLSGTRGATDFVEVPSHLFEYFASTPSVVHRWAGHHETGKPIPDGMLEESLKQKNNFSAVDFQTQVLFSAADQYVFGPEIGDVTNMTAKETYDHSLRGIVNLQRKLTDLPVGRMQIEKYDSHGYHPSMAVLSHSHFVNYGGGYYSYIFARMYAAQIWENVFQNDPLSREGGLFLWNRMLRFGAAKDTKKMLTELSGGGFRPQCYMKTL